MTQSTHSISLVPHPVWLWVWRDYFTPHSVLEYNKSKIEHALTCSCEVSILYYSHHSLGDDSACFFCSSVLLLMKLYGLYFSCGLLHFSVLGTCMVWIICIRHAVKLRKLHGWSCCRLLRRFGGHKVIFQLLPVLVSCLFFTFCD